MLVLSTLLLFNTLLLFVIPIDVSASPVTDENNGGPVINDPRFRAELVFKGIRYGTNMAILSHDDILVLERFEGTVQRIVNGQMLDEPILDVNVSSQDGMLGIAIVRVAKNITAYELSSSSTLSQNDNNTVRDVFLYYTESQDGDGAEGTGNRLYKYRLDDNGLTHADLLIDLPASPGPMHHGGEILIGPDDNIYFVIGEVGATDKIDSKAINVKNGLDPDGRAGILRVTQNGQIVDASILGHEHPLDMYYAYGIRNSFGMDFDPLTGNLWDTENGHDYGDEINLVEPGFNSGWKEVQGMIEDSKDITLLEDFDGKGKYSDPEFTWEISVGPTALKFLDSDKYGDEYENDMFVGDVNNGNIYHFELNDNRRELIVNGQLTDGLARTSLVIFGEGFGAISDIQVGPDGYMYILTHDKSEGAIFRIVRQ